MKQLVNIVNQVFELEKKLAANNAGNLQRNLDRIKAELADLGYSYHNPLHEGWDETRTDCEASISGTLKPKMLITEVVKPVVFYTENATRKIIQKAIVVVE